MPEIIVTHPDTKRSFVPVTVSFIERRSFKIQDWQDFICKFK